MSNPIIEVENVHKYYKQRGLSNKEKYVRAVHGATFSLYEGESFGLVGESGSGKSTLGQVILQLLKQTKGIIKYNGRDVSKFTRKERKNWRKDVQIVFQDPYSSLNPKKTVGWILSEPLIIHRIGNKEYQKQKVISTLEDVGLDASYWNRYPHELSGGQRQRVAIASAIILNPEFIVIDEGVSALDVSVQAQILNLLKRLQQKYQLTYLFISHDLNVVQYFCDRIAVMYLGEIVEIGKAEELAKGPKHPYAEALFSSILMHDEEDTRIILEGDLPDPSNPPDGCPFHNRCNYATNICRTKKPVNVHINDGHQVNCHLYGEKETLQNIT